MLPLRRLFSFLQIHYRLLLSEWGFASFKSRREIDISWYDTSIEQTIHTIFDIIFCDGWRIGEGVIPEILRQDSLWLENFIWSPRTYTKFFKLNIADSSLRSAIFERIWHRQRVLLPQDSVSCRIFWVPGEVPHLLLIHVHPHIFTQLHYLVRWSW